MNFLTESLVFPQKLQRGNLSLVVGTGLLRDAGVQDPAGVLFLKAQGLRGFFLPAHQHPVDQAVIARLVGAHEAVAVHVLRDLLRSAARCSPRGSR